MANTENISKILNVSPLPAKIEKEIVETPEATGNAAVDDFNYARENLRSIIEDGAEALGDMIDFATQTQHPRAYEVVATMMKELVSANKELLALSKQIKEIEKQAPAASPNNPGTVNNNLFVGSTAALQKLLKGEIGE